ncbi:WD40 repeat, subgroup [Pseudofrankia inefficax]|uniref:WD40 repeat, subgroup n=1 Tax=Pseudofrankia inefficax (strain DSM 45817 / CECT 9037 / DDB 130130 / EuI1c) TaxID=298654 RepID=E3J5X2_PSEI1|nr:WD40 repeat, subgroup [Pseudofrankia inefficax]
MTEIPPTQPPSAPPAKPARARATRTRANTRAKSTTSTTEAAATQDAATQAAPAPPAPPAPPAAQDTMPEPVETRSSSVGSTGSGDLGEFLRFLIPDDPTTGPVPIPPPAPDTGPMLLPPIDGPFATAAVTAPTAIPGDAPTRTRAAGADTTTRRSPATSGTATGETATEMSEAPTSVSEGAAGDDDPGRASPGAESPEEDASQEEPDAFAVVGVLPGPGRRRWAWARWLRVRWAWLLLWPVALIWSLVPGRRPALRWSLAPHTEPKPEGPRRLRWFFERGWRRSPRWSRPPRVSVLPGWARNRVDVTSPVYAVAFSPDARRLATASGNGAIRLWNITDPTTPRQRWTIRTRFAAGPAVAFSPDGAWLATGYDTAHAALWRIDRAGAPVPRALLDHPGGLTGLHFSADGRRLVGTFAGESARVWDVTVPSRPRVLGRAGDRRAARGAATFPDGRWLATVGERVEFWDVSSAPVRRTHLTAGEGPLFGVAVAPDGQTLAVGRNDGAVDLWHTVDPSAPAPRASIDAHSGWVTMVEFGSDGRWLATVSADQVALWDLTDPTVPVGRLRARLPVTAVAFSPARGLLAVASLDGSVNLLRPTAAIELSPAEPDLVPIRLADPDGLEDLRDPANAPAIPLPGERPSSKTTAQGAAFGVLSIWLGLALALSPHMTLVQALTIVIPAALGLLMVVFWWPAVLGPDRGDTSEDDSQPPTTDLPGTTSPGPVSTTGPIAGPLPIKGPATGPIRTTRPLPPTGPRTGPLPRTGPRTGPLPKTGPRTGPIPTTGPRTGPIPTTGPKTGPIPTTGPKTGPIPTTGPKTGPIPTAGPRTGPIPTAGPKTGPIPTAGPRTGPIPTAGPKTGPIPTAGPKTGPIPTTGPRAGSAPYAGPRTVPLPQTGPLSTGPGTRPLPTAAPRTGTRPGGPGPGADRADRVAGSATEPATGSTDGTSDGATASDGPASP